MLEKFVIDSIIYNVTSIDMYAFANCSTLTNISISSSITTIDYYAFYNCTSLTSIDIPSNVTNCGDYAFSSCSSLNSIIINSNLYNINNIFSELNSNTSIKFNYIGDIPNNACNNLSYITSVILTDSITSIGPSSFSGCSNLTSINIPNTISSIGSNAFSECTSLTNIVIPSSITYCGENAFSGCTNLQNIILNSYLENLGYVFFGVDNPNMSITFDYNGIIPDGACNGKSNLTIVTITNSITSIGKSAFSGCSNLKYINIPTSIINIDEDAFSYSGLTSINIINNELDISNLTTIGHSAFKNCQDLVSINIPNSVTNIGYALFNNNSKLTNIILSNNIVSIEDFSFENCATLTNINIPDSVTYIGYNAFKNCSSLIEVILSNNVSIINDNVFSNCTSLTQVTIPNDIISIGSNIFSGCSSNLIVNYNPNTNNLPLDTTWYEVMVNLSNSNDNTIITLLTCYMAVINRTNFVKLLYNNTDISFINNLLSVYSNNDNGNGHIFNSDYDNNTFNFNNIGTNINSIPLLDTIYSSQKWCLLENSIKYLDNNGIWNSLPDGNNISYSFTDIMNPSCFNEGTKILCLNKNLEEVYIPIETLRKGDLVKTYKHGYRRIELIGKNVIINNPDKFNQCMYKLSKTDENGLLEDLIITGWHSILVDNLNEYAEENTNLFGYTKMIDDKYMLISSVSKSFKKIESKEVFTYYHFVLENDGDNEKQYGIWANGVLTETQSMNSFKEKVYKLL